MENSYRAARDVIPPFFGTTFNEDRIICVIKKIELFV